MPMNPDVKEQWVAALKSDEYPHGYGQLLTPATDDKPASYCALGVLCEVAKKAGLELTPDPEDPTYSPYGRPGHVHFVPDAVLEWADLRADNEAAVVNKNDGGWTYDEQGKMTRLDTRPIVIEYIERYL